MTEQNYTTNYQNQMSPYGGDTNNGNPIVKFLLGLFTGVAVAAPVTGLIVKHICDKDKDAAVAKAYNDGGDAGMKAMLQTIQEETAKMAAEAAESVSEASDESDDEDIEDEAENAEKGLKTPNKGIPEGENDSDEEDSEKREFPKYIRNAEDPFYNGVPEKVLMQLVDQDLKNEGMSDEGLKEMKKTFLKDDGVFSMSLIASAYRNMLYAKAAELKSNTVKHIAEEKMKEKTEESKESLSDIPVEVEEGAPYAYTEVPVSQLYSHYEPDKNQPNRMPADYISVRNNPYLQGEIADPEARARFEKMLAETEFPTEEDINNYDLTIDDEEATQDAADFSATHVQYLEMTRLYKNLNGEIPPMTISREQFDNEHRMEKTYVNWYENDDVFVEDNDTRIDDPYYYFGFVSGKDMFSPERTANREDPYICYVRNFRTSTDFEITRTPGSYAQQIADGEAYYHGDTDSEF